MALVRSQTALARFLIRAWRPLLAGAAMVVGTVLWMAGFAVIFLGEPVRPLVAAWGGSLIGAGMVGYGLAYWALFMRDSG